MFDFQITIRFALHERVLAAATTPFPDKFAAHLDWPADLAHPDWQNAVAAYQSQVTDMLDVQNGRLQTFLLATTDASFCASAETPRSVLTLCRLRDAYEAEAWALDRRHSERWLTELHRQPVDWELISDDLAKALACDWPDRPVVVELAPIVGGPGAAYTMDAPKLITIGTQDQRHSGPYAVEILFHEASHLLIGTVEKAIEAASARLGIPTPESLWHAVLFFTVGEIIRKHFGNGYITYAENQGLYQRGAFKGMEHLLRNHWLPYLAGVIQLDTAIERMLRVSGPVAVQ